MRLIAIAAALSLAQAATLGADCNHVQTCVDTLLNQGCGWCWDSTTTVGQVHGGRPGNASGPTDGQGPCGDWTASGFDCHTHVDCPALPDCGNILGTNCGWCGSGDNPGGRRGTESGPSDGSNCTDWLWTHTDCPAIAGPQQVHVAWTNASGELVIMWADEAQDALATVQVAPASAWPAAASTFPAVHRSFGPAQGNPAGVPNYYTSRLSGLKQDTLYTYTVTSAGRVAGPFTTQTKPVDASKPVTLLVYGDMGRHGGGYILTALQREVDAAMATGEANTISAILHIGDFAYDLRDDGGVNGDTFMNRIQGMRTANGSRGSLASSMPYMTGVGNHEIGNGSFTQYRNRFTMPRSDEDDGFTMWWSMDVGGLHIITLSSEVYFARQQDIGKQLAWLKADLAKANANRDAVPWVLAHFHRPAWCSNLDEDDCTKPDSLVRAGLYDTLVEGKVDLVLSAHEHSYERLWPVAGNWTDPIIAYNYTDPPFPVNIVTGFAGCNEASGACLNPIAFPFGKWSAYRQSKEGTYTYSRLTVANRTHLHWQAFVPEEDRVEDDLWIIQHNH